MRDTKHRSLLAAATIMALGAGLPIVESPRSSQPIKAKPRRVATRAKTEIEAWNEAVEACKAAKKARKAATHPSRENQTKDTK